jgi:hypothetical protein
VGGLKFGFARYRVGKPTDPVQNQIGDSAPWFDQFFPCFADIHGYSPKASFVIAVLWMTGNGPQESLIFEYQGDLHAYTALNEKDRPETES